jgi:hypothetical protein
MAIDFTSTVPQYIANLCEIQPNFQRDDPGYGYITQRPVIYNRFASGHLTDEAHRSRLAWLEENQEGLVKVITKPDFIEKECRIRNDGHYSITLISELYLGSKKAGRFITVEISLSLNPVDGYHQITTIHPSKWTDIFYSNGLVKLKFTKLN